MAREFRITGRTVLFGMLAFFGVIIAVNLAFVYFALDSWPGLSSKNAYQEGLNYNRTLDAASKQASLGWRSGVRIEGGAIVVGMTGRDGAPIGGLAVRVRLERAVGDPMTENLNLTEQAPGVYSAPFTPRLSGRWLVAVDATGGGASFKMNHEVMVKP